jgi:hypothetical protein
MVYPASIALVKGIADATGLTDWIAGKFGDSAPVAKKVIETAMAISGAQSPQDAIKILSQDQVKAAECKAAIEAQEMELIKLAYDDLKSARTMYQNTGHDQADKIAESVIRYNLPMVGLLVCANALALCFIKEATIAVAVGNVIGASIQALWNERQQVIGFFFGSSFGSQKKTDLLTRG